MPSDDYLPTIEQNRLAWFNNFVTVASAVNISTTTRTAYHAANKNKTSANKTVTATVRSLARRVQANPAVTPALKTQL